jgi:hypothetical protein
MLGTKSAADAAIEFVKLDELTDDERKVMSEAGRSGRVITKVKKVPASAAGCMLPKRVVSEVQKRVPDVFNIAVHTRLWEQFKLLPAGWVAPAAARPCCHAGPVREHRRQEHRPDCRGGALVSSPVRTAALG